MKEERMEWKKYVKILAETFPKLMTDTKSQIQEAQRTPRGINTKRITHMHIIFK